MSEPLRIFLRLVGGVLFAGGTVAIAAFMAIGPADVGELMGESCKTATDKVGEASQCHWRQALDILRDLPWIVLVGAVMLAVLGPRRDRSTARSGMHWAGAAVLVVVVAVTMVGTPVYAHSWTAVRHYKVLKQLKRAAQETDWPGRSARRPAPAPAAPKTPVSGSLLRPATLRRSLAELRRLTPAGSRIAMLRVSPGRIDLEAVAGARVVKLAKPADGKARVVSASDGEPPAGSGTIAFARVDVRAPARIARAAGGRLEYAVLMDAAGLRWRGSTAGGHGTFAASLDGRRVERAS